MRIIAILLMLAGGGMLGGSVYIHNQVLQGRAQIAAAQKKVNTGKSLFSVDPTAKKVGNQLFKPIDKKLAEARGEATYYERLASQLQMGGIILLVIGAGMFLFGKRRS